MDFTTPKKGFKKDDVLICVHEVEGMAQGERIPVFGICPGCRGILIEDSPLHFKEDDFELFTAEPFKRQDENLVHKDLVVNMCIDLAKMTLMNSRNGFVAIDIIADVMSQNLVQMGLQKEYRMPENNR